MHSDAPWELGGVLIAERWHPAKAGLVEPSARLAEAGLVRLVPIPPFLAPDDRAAVRVAIAEAMRGGLRVATTRTGAGALRGPRTHRVSLPTLLDGSRVPSRDSR